MQFEIYHSKLTIFSATGDKSSNSVFLSLNYEKDCEIWSTLKCKTYLRLPYSTTNLSRGMLLFEITLLIFAFYNSSLISFSLSMIKTEELNRNY